MSEIIVWRLKCVASSKMEMKKKMEIIFSDMDCIGIRWDSFYCIVDKLFQSTWSVRQT